MLLHRIITAFQYQIVNDISCSLARTCIPKRRRLTHHAHAASRTPCNSPPPTAETIAELFYCPRNQLEIPSNSLLRVQVCAKTAQSAAAAAIRSMQHPRRLPVRLIQV